jgi:dihydrofolate synthase/folylpolyglutamate synthase
VLEVLQAEADQLDAEFAWIAPMDMGQYLGESSEGARMRLGRYGDLTLSLHGRYQVDNATLAVQGAGNMHARLNGISHGSPEYAERIRAGLSSVIWPGRLQKLQDAPAVYLDGAINGESARLLVRSLEGQLTDPVIAIIAVPTDKDAAGVYRELGLIAETLILTATERNPILHWAAPAAALAEAKRFNSDSRYAPDLGAAVEQAKALAGSSGTILIVGTQSIIADAIALWGLSYEQI